MTIMIAAELGDTVVRALGLVAFVVIGFFVAQVIERVLQRLLTRNGARYRGVVEAKLISWFTYAVAVSFALSTAIPGVELVDILTGFGFISVGLGFAFRNILENTMSGLLLLYRQPFEVGDQIQFEDFEGTVEAVDVRTTQVRTYDGRLVYIPNREVFQGNIVVETERDRRRIDLIVGVAYSVDLPTATAAILEAVQQINSVRQDPPAEAFALEFGVNAVNIQIRCWGPSYQDDHLRTTDAIVKAVKQRLDHDRIEMPANIVALQGTDSFRAALYDRGVTAAGSVNLDTPTDD